MKPAPTGTITWAGSVSSAPPRSRVKVDPTSQTSSKFGSTTVGSVTSETVTPSGSAPGAIWTTVPSVDWTTPPSAPMVADPTCGRTTLTGMISSAGPLMIVTVVSPTPAEVARPSGEIATTEPSELM